MWLLLVLAAWSISIPLRAATPVASAARKVAVHLVGSEADRALALAVLHERLDPLELQVSFDAPEHFDADDVLVPGAVAADDLARIWLDLTPAERSMLYVTDGPWERILVRRFDRRANFEVTAEELGHAVLSAVLALRAGERIGVTRAELAPPPVRVAEAAPPAVVRPPPPPPNPWHLHGAVFFEGSAYGNGPELASGPGGMLQVEHVRGARVLGGLLSGQFRLPSSVTRGPATVDLDGGAFRALGIAGVRIAERWQVAGVGGVGLDVLDATTRASVDVRSMSVNTVSPVLRLGAQGLWQSRWLRVFALVGLDVQPTRTRYLLERTSGTTAVLFEPWRAQPFLAVGLQTP